MRKIVYLHLEKEKISRLILDECSRHSSLVEPRGEQGVLLDLSTFKRAGEIVKELAVFIHRQNAGPACLGLASNPLLAFCATCSSIPVQVKGRSTYRLQSYHNVLILQVLPGQEASFLPGLPLQEFPALPVKERQKLMRLGYSRVGEIAGLSRERFMNPERVGMPDIDIDFEYRHRDRVIDYVYRRYGHDHVAWVATYNTFHARSALRSLGKALGFSEEELDPLAKRIPHYACADQIRPLMTVLPELQGSPLGEPRYQLLLDSCEKLAGFPRFLGMHLGGVVISDVPLINLTPLQKSGLGPVICQFDMLNNQPMGFYPPRVIGNEARRRGIVLLPMDINISGIDFTVEIMEEGKEAI